MSAQRTDPWDGAGSVAQVDLLRARGIAAYAHADGPHVDLVGARLVLVVWSGTEGSAALDRLQGQHGELPRGPRWIDGVGRRCLLYRAPHGLHHDAVHLHGTAPGVSVIARGDVALPPSAAAGSIQIRWGVHPATCPLADLPEWLADVARDPTAAHRAWDTVTRTPAAKAALDDWQKSLTWERGKIARTHGNLCAILRSSPTYAGRLTYDEMACAPCLDRAAITDAAAGALREKIERDLAVAFGADALWAAIATVADERRVHPVRDYLRALRWDGTPRLDAAGPALLGATTPLEALLMRRWMIAAVARALRRGCKMDCALVLVGPQGASKSRLFATLAGAWFCDTATDLREKDALLQLASAWVIEWGEFERVTSQRGADEIKSFLSSTTDRYRPPYGRALITVPRTCVIVGSTNQQTFLDDDTGDRRFWCVRVGVIDLALAATWRDQLWAEAVAALDAGEPWHLTAEEDTARAAASAQHRVEDPWAALVARWLEAHERADHTASEILAGAIDLPRRDHTKSAAMRLGRLMRSLGWQRENRRPLRDGKSLAPAWLWVDTRPRAAVGCETLDGFEPA